jgi:hypothetical protein
MNARQILDALPGLTYRQLDGWTRAGYLRALPPDPGTGRARRYAAGEVEVAALMLRLKQAGLNTRTAHRVARQLAAGQPAVLGPGIELTLTDTQQT